jgi:DnaJ-class molecular chaperone
MAWSITKALDVIKWIIETYGGNDDAQAYRQICSYINEAEKTTTNKTNSGICPLCDGSGEMTHNPDTFGDKCVKCNGSGKQID